MWKAFQEVFEEFENFIRILFAELENASKGCLCFIVNAKVPFL
jgi:hypothetical protein